MLFIYIISLLIWSHPVLGEGNGCAGRVAMYRVTLETWWDSNRWPRHYPEWGPKAEWSRMMGLTHSSDYHLFQLGSKASPSLKLLAEEGETEGLANIMERSDTTLDSFVGRAIPRGRGKSSARVFASGEFSRLSFSSKLIPSPDWFVGLDSFELCQGGRFVGEAEMKLDPLDAGTDSGLTFTSPNWPTEDFVDSSSEKRDSGLVSRIRLRGGSPQARHPAGSFHYKGVKELPKMGKVVIKKLFEYTEASSSSSPAASTTSSPRRKKNKTSKNQHFLHVSDVNKFSSSLDMRVQNDEATSNRKRSNGRKTKNQKQRSKKQVADPCAPLVSAWSIWSPCSRPLCHQHGGREKRFRKTVSTDSRNEDCPTTEFRECKRKRKKACKKDARRKKNRN